jgi:hypothetical protein
MVEDAGRRGNMLIVFKLDFEKMYYWINWDFLNYCVEKKFGIKWT